MSHRHDWQYKVSSGDHEGMVTCYWVVCAECGRGEGHHETLEAAMSEIHQLELKDRGEFGLSRRLRLARKPQARR